MRPTEPGWYWYFALNNSRPVRVVCCGYWDGNGGGPPRFVAEAGVENPEPIGLYEGQFIGPLVPPERPKV